MERVDFEELGYDYEKYVDTYKCEPFTGIAYECAANGTLIAEVPFCNGIRDGIARFWYPSGSIEKIWNYKLGIGHGINQEWFENGHMKMEKKIEFGVCVWRKTWSEQGDLIEEYILPEDDMLYKTVLRLRCKE